MERIKNFLSGKKSSPTSPPPYLLAIRSSKPFILTTICIAVFTDIFLYSIIVPVIPFALSSRAGVAESSVQSYVSILLAAYGAALLVSSPFAGCYADRSSSRRFPLLLGLFALAGATIMLCLARTVALLIVGRILQGLSAAIVWTVGQALLVDTVGQKDIGQTLGWVSLSMTVGILLAPLLGGVVYNKAGYYAIYYMAFGLIALDIFFRLALIEKKVARQWIEDDATDFEGMSSPEQGSDGGENYEEKTANVSSDPGQSFSTENSQDKVEEASSLESKTTEVHPPEIHPPPPVSTSRPPSKYPPVLTLLASTRLLVALWAIIVQGTLMTAFDSVVPLYVQETFHWDSIGAGLVFLALIVPSFISPAVGWVSDRYGPRWLCVGGFIFAIPFWILLRLVTHDTIEQKVLFCAFLVLIGVGLTLGKGRLGA